MAKSCFPWKHIVISGFRVCGIYPFNLTAILSKCPESSSKKDASSNAQRSCNSEQTDGDNTETVSSFTPEKEQLFLRRFEEGFNSRTWPQIYFLTWAWPPWSRFHGFFFHRTQLAKFSPQTTPLDAIAVCDDSSNIKVAEIEDSTSIVTTPDEAITHRREKEIKYLTPRLIAVSLDGGSKVSSKEQITLPNVKRAGRSETDDEALTSDECSEEDCDCECCECIRSFQQDIAEKNGAEWVRCGCGQWIHEDYIDQVVTDKDDKDRLCSNYVL